MLTETLPEATIDTCGEKDIAVALCNIADESDFNKKETDDYPKDDEIELDFSRHINCIECTSS